MSGDVIGGNAFMKVVNQGVNDISSMNNELADKINNLKNTNNEDKQAELVKINYLMGQHNAVIEMYGNVVSSFNECVKSLANKAG